MKLASNEAINLMIEGESLVNGQMRAFYSKESGFMVTYGYKDINPKTEHIAFLWNRDKEWTLEKKYIQIPEEWTHDWATFRAVDAGGSLYEFRNKPKKGNVLWMPQIYLHYAFISDGHDPTNWENSLQPRLTTSAEPTTTGEQSMLKSLLDRVERLERMIKDNESDYWDDGGC